MSMKIFRKISSRFIDEVPDRFIKRYLFIEINAMVRVRLLGQDEETVLFRRNRLFQKKIPETSIARADAVIGFDTSSWILAERCRKLSQKFILDVSIAHPVSKHTVYRQIIKLYPDWKFSIRQKDHKYIAIEEAEMEQANHIVVASNFTLNTYVEHGVSAGKIIMNSYGVDASSFKPAKKQRRSGDIIRFVFVGLVDARKGIPSLLEVWKSLQASNIELTLIGPITPGIENFIHEHYPSVIIKGRLAYKELKEMLPGYDVLVFPSFFEGFALVIPEAMACGLPVITTTSTCGPDIIENGKEGYIIDPGDVTKLKEAMEYFIDQPGRIQDMGIWARKKAEQYSWDAYGVRWQQMLQAAGKRKNTF